MPSLSRTSVVLAAVFVASLAQAVAVQANPQRLIAVPRVDGLSDLGRAPQATRVSVALTLPYRHASQLDDLLDAQSTPGSPLYKHFLSSAQFNAFFAPDPAAYTRLTQSLRGFGFSIAREYPNRTLIVASVPVRTAERMFGTEIHLVSQPGAGVRYTNVRQATLPAGLADSVISVVGLDNLRKAKWMHEFGHRAAGVQPDKIGPPLHGPDGGFGPLALAEGFDFPVQHGYDGTGETVANVAGDVLDSDLSAFESEFGITRTGTTLRTTIQSPGQDADVEATLDLETMGSLDPGADIHLYILEDPVDAIGEQAYNQIVTDNSVVAVNSSFGVCETSDLAYALAAQQIIKQGEALGISWSASTGDNGAFECGSGQLAPAVIPDVTGVGGTSLTVGPNGKLITQSAWSGGGGGPSIHFKLPPFQHGIKGLVSTTNRNLPDIAFPADPATGYSFYYQGSWQGPIGGTSWASPTFIALEGEFDQMEGAREGKTNPHIYAMFKRGGYRNFIDVTTGNNGYPAGPGYDDATGIGSIEGYKFAHQL